jgi:hypothetical protein
MVGVVASALAVVGCTASSAEPPASPPAPPVHDVSRQVVYPRTATYWLEQDRSLPPVADLARYDLVVIDSEWANRVDHRIFSELRQLNPDIILLAYVNLIDYPARLGSSGYWADRYALWQYWGPTFSTFPASWLARTADGDSVSEWPNSLMTNLADVAPRVNGQLYSEYAANWVNEQVWSTGLWDGIFLDVWGDRIYSADRDSWDVDGDGTDDPSSAIYGPGGPWERGVTRAEQIMRAEMPDAILVGNGDRTLRDQVLNGLALESFADHRADRDPSGHIAQYLRLSVDPNHRRPGITLTINQRRTPAGSALDYRNARFFITATLLQDGFWAPMGQDYGELAYYDEMDGGGLGSGYLGQAVVADPTPDQLAAWYAGGVGTVAPGVVRRDFEHGIVLNNSSMEPHFVNLRGTFRKVRGSQDPSVNDGELVTSVTIPAHDGLVLLAVPEAG